MCASPPNSSVEVLIPNVLVLGGGAFRRGLGSEGGALMKKTPYDQHPYKQDPKAIPNPVCHVRTQHQVRHLRTRKWAIIRHQICLRHDHGLPSLQNGKQYISDVF